MNRSKQRKSREQLLAASIATLNDFVRCEMELGRRNMTSGMRSPACGTAATIRRSSRHEGAADMNQAGNLMRVILDAIVTVDDKPTRIRTLAQTLASLRPSEASKHATCVSTLAEAGIALDRLTQKDIAIAAQAGITGLCCGDRCIILAHRTIADQLLRQTEWCSMPIMKLLRQIPCAIYSRRRVAGQRERVIIFDLEGFCQEFLRDDKPDEARQAA